MLTCTHDSREGVEPTVLTPGRDCVDTETKEGGPCQREPCGYLGQGSPQVSVQFLVWPIPG